MKFQKVCFVPLVLVVAMLLAFAGCSERGTESNVTTTADISMAISGIEVDGISQVLLTVTDPLGETIIEGPVELTFNDGIISGSVRVPAGVALLFTIEVLNEQQLVLYRGSTLGRVSEQEALTLDITLTAVAPLLRLSPAHFAVQEAQTFRMAIQIDELPTLQDLTCGFKYDPTLLTLDSGQLNRRVSDDISFNVFDSGNGNVAFFINDYKPLVDPPNSDPNVNRDSITLGWLHFRVARALNGPAATEVVISSITAANDNQGPLNDPISTRGTEVDISIEPTGGVPEVFIISPDDSATVGDTIIFEAQVLGDEDVAPRDIILLFEGVAQPGNFIKKQGSVNLYTYPLIVQFQQPETFLNFQVQVTDTDGNIARSDVHSVFYLPPPQ